MAYNAKPNKPDKYMSGYYKLVNESKYASNPNQIIYRSSLEYKFCKILDNNPRVLRWGSEIVSIPYIGADNKQHTYHIDFYVEVKNENADCGYDRLLVEVKPSAETENIIKNSPPQKPKVLTAKSLKNWQYGILEFRKNQLKWKYASAFALSKGMKFVVITEKTINKFS